MRERGVAKSGTERGGVVRGGWCGHFSSIRDRAVEASLGTSRRGNSPASETQGAVKRVSDF